jgi:pilus assembly protein Flp/PilA
MPSLVKRFIASESGSTALEYGLVAAGITVVAVTALNAVFTLFAGLFAPLSPISRRQATDPSRDEREAEAAH